MTMTLTMRVTMTTTVARSQAHTIIAISFLTVIPAIADRSEGFLSVFLFLFFFFHSPPPPPLRLPPPLLLPPRGPPCKTCTHVSHQEISILTLNFNTSFVGNLTNVATLEYFTLTMFFLGSVSDAKQTMWFQTQSRTSKHTCFQTQPGTSKTTSERDDVQCVFLHTKNKCKVHAVKLRLQSGLTSLQCEMIVD